MSKQEDQLIAEVYNNILLKEMPVRDVRTLSQTIGGVPETPVRPARGASDTDKRDYADQMLIRSQAWKNKIRLKVAPNVPYTFDIILEDKVEQTRSLRSDITEIVPFLKKHIKPSPETITVVLNSTGDPMTPWIISHKIGHAIFETINHTGYTKMGQTQDIRTDCRQMIDLMTRRIVGIGSADTTKTYDRQWAINKMAHEIHQSSAATFKAARQKSIVAADEYLYELVAMYLQKGKIAFDPVMRDGAPVVDEDGVVKLDQNKANFFAKRFTDNITNLLNLCVGEVIVDY